MREAEARAEEAEARARQAEAEAAAAEQAREGLPLWYGWGAGPVAWPTGPIVVPRSVPSGRRGERDDCGRLVLVVVAPGRRPSPRRRRWTRSWRGTWPRAAGARRWPRVRTLRMTGRAVAGPGREAIVRREIARPDRIRTEFEFQGTTGVYVWNGKSGWQVSPLDGQLDSEPLPAEAAALSAEQADFEGPLVDWKAKGHKVELVGRAALPGGTAYELKVTLKSGVVRRVFVDAAAASW